MNIYLRNLRGLALLAVVALLTQTLSAARIVEESFAVLKTKTGTYTNATVTTKAKDYVFVLYDGGMANIKLNELMPDTLRELGYSVPDDPANATNHLAALASKAIPASLSKNLAPLEEKLQSRWLAERRKLDLSPTTIGVALAVTFVFYLFFCYCCHLICVKANRPASILVWLPGLQGIPLLKAANMSGWWFLAYFVPLLNIVVQVMWSLNIAKARSKSVWIAVCLLLPIVNLFGFLYLAFSSAGAKDDGPKYQSMSLQTA